MTEPKNPDESWVDEYKEYLEKIEERLSKEPHMPKKVPRPVLMRFLQAYNLNVDKASKLFIENVQFRVNHPQLFINRDVNSKEIKLAMEAVQFCPFPFYTKENLQITGFRLMNTSPENFHLNDIFKYIVMVHDIMNIYQPQNDGDIFIFDAKEFAFWHFMKVVGNLLNVRTFMKYEEGVCPVRAKKNHVINCSPTLVKFAAFLKPFISKEVNETFHYHTSVETLHDFVPKELIPVEYGGTLGKFEDHFQKTVENLNKYRDYLLKDENFFIQQK